MTLKVLSYNIHKGFSLANREYVLDRMREAIRQTGAEIVFLQEVQGESNQHRDVQFEYLADSVWSHYAYGKNALTSKGHHGNAILSRLPFESWENFDLSTNPYEQRGVLHGVIRWQDQPLHLWCTHLNLFEGERREQAEWIAELVRKRVPAGERVILAGDFNDWRGRLNPWFKRELDFEECFAHLHGESARTFPSLWPKLKLDRIFTRGLTPVVARTPEGVAWRELSDHVPLWVELE